MAFKSGFKLCKLRVMMARVQYTLYEWYSIHCIKVFTILITDMNTTVTTDTTATTTNSSKNTTIKHNGTEKMSLFFMGLIGRMYLSPDMRSILEEWCQHIDQCKLVVSIKKWVDINKYKYIYIKLVHACWENRQYALTMQVPFGDTAL